MAARDHNREFLALIELVKDHGEAQAEAVRRSGKEPQLHDYWRVEPGSPADWQKGATLHIYPEGASVAFKARYPKTGCTEQTVKILGGSLERYGFDTKQALKDRQHRQHRATQEAADLALAKEKARHIAAQASKPAAPLVKVKKVEKKWPRLDPVEADISPIQALEMLEEKGDGSLTARPLSEVNIQRFVKIIEDGLWVPDFFHVDWYGYLLNGRHRCEAIIRADRTIPCRIIYGCDPEMFAVFDSPKARTGGDTLVIEKLAGRDGLDDASNVHQGNMASALKMLTDYKSGRDAGTFGRERVENFQFVQLASRFPGIYRAMEQAKVLHVGRRIGVAKFMPSPAIVFCYLVMEAWPEAGELLDSFMIGVTLGENQSGDDPRKKLYNSMMSAQKTKRAKIIGVEQLALLLKMWNYWVTGRKAPAALAWRRDEPMPVPVTRADAERRLPGM